MTQTGALEFDSPISDTAPLSRKERAAVLARISALVEYWGFTAEELSSSWSGLDFVAAKPPRPVKYRHPVTGDTWDGEGLHPEWLRDALLKQGMRLDELRPENQPGV